MRQAQGQQDCIFFLGGRCAKGSLCPYKHDAVRGAALACACRVCSMPLPAAAAACCLPMLPPLRDPVARLHALLAEQAARAPAGRGSGGPWRRRISCAAAARRRHCGLWLA